MLYLYSISTNKQIGINGVLAFDDPNQSIIAPLFVDVDTRGTGNVYYR